MQINRRKKTSMCKNNENRPLAPLFQKVSLRLDDSFAGKDREMASIHAAAGNDGEARGTCAVKVTRSMEALPGTPRCDLMEGGLRI